MCLKVVLFVMNSFHLNLKESEIFPNDLYILWLCFCIGGFSFRIPSSKENHSGISSSSLLALKAAELLTTTNTVQPFSSEKAKLSYRNNNKS